jgi:hypothetical protein
LYRNRHGVGAPVVQVGNMMAEVCRMGSVTHCRTSIAAWQAVAIEQTRLAAHRHGMWPTLLLGGMVNAAPWPGLSVVR